jgi:predicted permease
LYPASFRTEYGDEMLAVWARRRRDVSGPLAVAGLWTAMVFETVANAAAVHGDIFRQDLRYSVRSLARSPGYVLTAILVLAFGVGANTAAFSVTDFVLIRPLPFKDPERLVKLWETTPGYARMEFSAANYRDIRGMSQSFEATGAFVDSVSVNLVGRGDPERQEGAWVTADLLPLLGVPPLMGRMFTAAEDRDGASGTVVLSYSLWQGVFGGEPGIVGSRITLDNDAYTVIGVMPRDFHFPKPTTELWMPARFPNEAFQDRNDNDLEVLGRLRQGATLAQARAEVGVNMRQLRLQYPKELENTGGTAIGLRDELSQKSRLLLVALSAAAVCVLLIACANLANLLLARALTRGKELAVRAAIGAGRDRLVRQMVTESLVPGVSGGALGVLVAGAAVPLLTRLIPNTLPIAQTPAVDWRVLGFAALLTLMTVIGFGLLPAWRICRSADLSALREGVRAGGGRKERVRSMLVIAEVTASVVLLVSAGLLLRAMRRVQATDPGFRIADVVTLGTPLPMPKYQAMVRRTAFYTNVLSQVRALPGVRNAAYVSFLPMAMGGGIWPVVVAGHPPERSANQTASLRFVTPGFFATLGIPLYRGRDVAEGDTVTTQFVAVVSQSFVGRYWPGQDPLGRSFKFALHDRVVVGVVGDIRVRGLERPSEPQVYVPYRQMPDGELTFYAPKNLVIRSAAAVPLLPAVRQIVRATDAEQPISGVRTMAEIVEDQTAPRVAQVRVLGAFAGLAFLLAGVGIHGLLSFAVSRRRQEIGVRIALGARPSGIVGMVVRQGAGLALAGLAPGLVLAYLAARAMTGLLAGIPPWDTLSFSCAMGLCLLMTVLGSLLPAWRAVRIDPMQAMRTD